MTYRGKHEIDQGGKAGDSIFGTSPNVLVSRSALRQYLGEYHHNGRRNTCTADGQDWPCTVYSELRRAAYPEEFVK